MIKRVIYYTLLIIWICISFTFSEQDAPTSTSLSKKVATGIIETAEKVSKKEITKKDKKEFVDNSQFLIRKTAHFTLYFFLGWIAYGLMDTYPIEHKWRYAIVLCFSLACFDEFHQLFSSGRCGRFLDIGIDTAGGILSSYLMSLFLNWKRKRVVE